MKLTAELYVADVPDPKLLADFVAAGVALEQSKGPGLGTTPGFIEAAKAAAKTVAHYTGPGAVAEAAAAAPLEVWTVQAAMAAPVAPVDSQPQASLTPEPEPDSDAAAAADDDGAAAAAPGGVVATKRKRRTKAEMAAARAAEEGAAAATAAAPPPPPPPPAAAAAPFAPPAGAAVPPGMGIAAPSNPPMMAAPAPSTPAVAVQAAALPVVAAAAAPVTDANGFPAQEHLREVVMAGHAREVGMPQRIMMSSVYPNGDPKPVWYTVEAVPAEHRARLMAEIGAA